MRTYQAHVVELHWRGSLGAAAWIECSAAAIPPPGRYTLARATPANASQRADAMGDLQDLLPAPLFASAAWPAFEDPLEGFLAAPPLPHAWQPGTQLQLRGPLGHGFSLPVGIRRLAAAALGDSAERLLALVYPALARETAAALFTDCLLADLPSALEVHPLSELPEAPAWADFLALDLPPQAMPHLRSRLGLQAGELTLPCPAQALLTTAMPCGALADCGACAVETRRGWKLACKDGPVFDLVELLARA